MTTLCKLTMTFSRVTLFILIGLLVYGDAWAQRNRRPMRERSPQQELIYENHNYLPVIRSVQFHPKEEKTALPVIDLGAPTPLILSFDDLRGDIRNYYYSIEHCTADWKSSNLSPLEYVEGFNEDRVLSFQPSVNTLQAYTNYQLEIPSRQVKPKLAGNYLLKVYEDADKRRLVLTQKFYVVRPIFSVLSEVLPSSNNQFRANNQKINLTVHTGSQRLNNPFQEIKVLVMQNQRPDVQQWLSRPSHVQEGTVQYRDLTTLDFPGGNEFRYVDLRSFRLASERVREIYRDSLMRIDLLSDQATTGQSYGSLFDENGAFYLDNQDRPDAPEESDYAQVRFSLKVDPISLKTWDGTPISESQIHVVGAFNHYQRTTENQLHYQSESEQWEVTLPLKQGLYNYEYVLESPSSGYAPFHFSGSHFQTGNTYQILVYFRRPGTTWDEIAAYQILSNRD